MATEFTTKVIKWIRKIPHGRVATYGQIASLAGKPHAARGVTWILSSSSASHDLPWHRVLNAKGQIAFPWGSKYFRIQKRLLESEGISVRKPAQIDLKEFQWNKTPTRAPRRGPNLFR